MKNLLLLTYHFPPSAASGTFRMLGFARHLPRFDWRVQVVAPPSMPWEPTDPKLLQRVPAETEYEAVPYPVGAPKALRWAFGSALWLPWAERACRRLLRERPFDAVLTSGPPHIIHMLGLRLKRKYGLPWVADFRDPWVNNEARSRHALTERWLLHWERRVFRSANAVLANAPNAARLFQSTHPEAAERIITLTNGFDPEDFSTADVPRGDDTLRLVHAGELYAGRDPLPLLDALAALNRQGRKLRLDILGRNHLDGIDLESEIRRRGLVGDVVLHGQLPYAKALAEMRRADVLVLFDTPGRKIGVPAKLYEYFGAGRSILALAERDGDTANVLRASGLPQRVASPGDATAIREALSELSCLPDAAPDERRLAQFTRANLARRLAEVLDRASGNETRFFAETAERVAA